MALLNVWSPDSVAIEGWLIEVPIRAPKLPANLWVHWAGLAMNWSGFPPAMKNGDWHDAPGVLVAPVPAGDTVLSGQGALGIASAHREEQGFFDTDDWGMALNAVGTLPGVIEGPGGVALPVDLATLGNCWPVAVSLTIDLLVLRTSLIPAIPLPYGQRPKPDRFRDRVDRREAYLDELRAVSGRAEELRHLLEVMGELTEHTSERASQPAPSFGLPRRTTICLSMALASPLTPRCSPLREADASKKTPSSGKPRRKR